MPYAEVNGLSMYYEVHGTHVTLVHKADWVVSMVAQFLAGPQDAGE